MSQHVVLTRRASLVASRGSSAPSAVPQIEPGRRGQRTGSVRAHRDPASARRAHRRLRGRVHPAPRVAPAGQDTVGLVRLDHLGGRTAAVVRLRDVRALGRQPGQPGGPGGGRAGQRPQRHATRPVRGERALRVPAGGSRAARACRSRPLGSSSRPWTSMPGAAKAFEAALGAGQSTLQGETLWYRMVAGGAAPRYVRLRPRPSLAAILDGTERTGAPRRRRAS